MKRWHEDRNVMARQQKTQERMIVAGLDIEPRRVAMGRFRKYHALDCGRTRCHRCHYAKLCDFRRRDEEIADLNQKEQLKELREA